MYRKDKYFSFSELKQNETEGEDFAVFLRQGRSAVAVMAPHGGNIEPGTFEIADAVASDDHTFYSFCGLKTKGNWSLHLASTNFDEPIALHSARYARLVVTIHGCKGDDEIVTVGGLDRHLGRAMRKALVASGFRTGERDGLRGVDPRNLCNHGSSGMGVQMELSTGLRRSMFQDLTWKGRERRTEAFTRFVHALRQALSSSAYLPAAPAGFSGDGRISKNTAVISKRGR